MIFHNPFVEESFEPTLPDIASSTMPVPGGDGILQASERDSSGVVISWDEASDAECAQEDLLYRIVTSLSNNISTTETAEANGTVHTDWSANLTSVTITTMPVGVPFFITVMVMDDSGNMAIYKTISYTFNDTAVPVPGANGVITGANIQANSLDITWSAAGDNATATTALEYKAVMSNTGNIATYADAEANGIVIVDWSAGLTSASASGLTEATTYYFTVLVRDESGNTAAYTMKQILTLSSNSPQPGNGGLLTIDAVTVSTIDGSFSVANDDVTAAADLMYQVVISPANNIDTVANAVANGTVAVDWIQNGGAFSLVGLTEGTRYYINVLVKDENSNIAAYSTVETATSDMSAPVPGADGGIAITNATSVAADLAWQAAADNYSPAVSLEYMLVSSTVNNIGTLADAKANGTIVVNWAANMTGYTMSGLTDATTYYVTVLVRDEAGNEAAYTAGSFTTPDMTVPTPGNGGAISMSSITADGFDVTWTIGSDNVSLSANLEYMVVYSFSNNIGTPVDGEANGTLIQGWTLDDNRVTASGLSAGTLYYITVVVRDEAGNMSSYAVDMVTTLDNVAPTCADTTITVGNIRTTAFDLSWTKATDNLTVQANLVYRVVRSVSNDIDTADNADLNGTVIMDWTADVAGYSVSGLTDTQTYYFNILVKDENNNNAAYTMVSATTMDGTAPVPGISGTIGYSPVSGTAVDLSWTKATDNESLQSALEYRIVRSDTNDIDTVTNANTNGTEVMAWSIDSAAYSVTGLPVQQYHYFTVMVRDVAGNEAVYTMKKVMMSNTLTPVADASVRSGINALFNYGTQTVVVTKNAGLTDYSRRAFVKFDISGYEAADIESAVLRLYVTDTETNLPNKTIEVYGNGDTSWGETSITWLNQPAATTFITQQEFDLTVNVWYEFAVTDYLKSVAGSTYVSFELMQQYMHDYSYTEYTSREGANPPQLVITAPGDGTVPTVGNSGALSSGFVSGQTVEVLWSAASDDVTAQSGIEYRVYYSTGNDIASVADMEANGTLAGTQIDTTAFYVDGLTAHTTYYFNVMAVDGSLNKAAYVPMSVTTTYSATVTDDTQVRGGFYSFMNYGSTTWMYNCYGSSTDNDRKIFFKFDFASYPYGTVTSAKLRFYVHYVDPVMASRSVRVYGNADTSWSESSVTWNSDPVESTYITTFNVDGELMFYEIDVTAYVSGVLVNDVVSLELVNLDTMHDFSLFYVNSKEASHYAPELIMVGP